MSITGTNDLPSVTVGTASTSRALGGVASGSFVASDVDAGDTTSTTASAAHGTVTVDNTNHTYAYTANNDGFVGNDTVTFTTTDGHGQSVTQTAVVTVADSGPTETVGNTSGSRGAGFAKGTFNASDLDGPTDTLSTTASAGHGTVTVDNTNHTYTYTANNDGFVGNDTVTFTTTDSHGQSATQTATVEVDPTTLQGATITAPLTVADTENHAASFSLKVTDTHTGEAVSAVTITGAPSGSVLSVGGQTIAADSHGTFTLTPAQAADASLAITPPTDFSGTMNLQANATVGALDAVSPLTTSQSIQVNVAAVTQGASITAPSSVADTENHAASFSLNVADTHTGETVNSVTITGAPSGAMLSVNGIAIGANGDGSFTLTPAQASSASLSITPPTDYSGTMHLQVSAVAENGSAAAVTTTQNIDVNVAAQTQGATIAAPSAIGDIQGQATSFSLNVSDSHLHESVTGVTISGAQSGSVLSVNGVTIAADSSGNFNLTPVQASSASLSITPPSTYSGTMTLHVSATADATGAASLTTTQDIQVNVTAQASTGATIAAPSAMNDVENHAASFSLNVADYHSGEDVSSVAITGAPIGSTLTVNGVPVAQAADGSFALSPDQASGDTIAITPPTDYTGTMHLQVQATAVDANGNDIASTPHALDISVSAATQGASISAPATVSGTENQSAAFSIGVSDAHLNESVTGVTITGAPAGSVLTVGGSAITANADGSFTLTPAQAASADLSIKPPTDFSGTMNLHVNATADATGAAALTTSQTVSINVGAVTQGADITAPATVTGSENHAASIGLSVSDSHLGEHVTNVTIMGAPSGSTMVVDGTPVHANSDGSFTLTADQASNGHIALTPPTDFSGSMDLMVNATAQNGSAATVTTVDTIHVDVAAVTQGASISMDSTATVTENHATAIALNVSDSHLHESVTGVTISGAPVGSTLTVGVDTIAQNADGTFSLSPAQAANASLHLTPPTDYVGTMTLQVAATADASGAAPATITQSITVDVTGVTQGATIDAPQAVGGIANQATPFVIGVSDGHLGEAVTSVTITGAPAGTTLSVNGQSIAANADGSFTLTPDQASHAGLAITPPANFTGAMNLMVNATADATGAVPVTTSQALTLNITAGAAEGATIAAPTTVADAENHTASFNLNVADTHLGEHVSTVTLTGAPAGSVLTVGGQTIAADSQGNFTLTPAQASHSSLTITPPTDYSGHMTLHVNATAVGLDGASVTNTQDITVNVDAVTQGASLTAPTGVAGSENHSAPLSLAVADTHTGESVTGVAISGAPTGTTLTVGGQTIAADSHGVFHLTAAQANDSSLAINAPTDFSGSMTLQVDATAANGSAAAVTTSQHVTVDIAAVTQGATVGTPAALTVNENNAVAFHLNTSDLHSGESISSVVISGAPTGSTLSIGGMTLLPGSDGSFHLSPQQAASADLSINPPKDFFGPMNLQVDATAANGSAAAVTTSQIVEVNVLQTTQGASITAPSTLSDTENHASSFTLNVSDTHSGEGVTTVTITGAPAGAVLTVGGQVITQNADHSFTLTPDQASNTSLAITPPTDYSGTMTLHVNATADTYSDSTGAAAVTNSQTITMNVSAVTQGASIAAPVAVGEEISYSGSGTHKVYTNHGASFNLNVADAHAGETVSSVTITGAPSGSSLSVGGTAIHQNTDGSFTLTAAQAANAQVSLTPPSTSTTAFSLHVNATAHESGAADVVTTQTINIVPKSSSSSLFMAGPGTVNDVQGHAVTFTENTWDNYAGATSKTFTLGSGNSTAIPQGTQVMVNGTAVTQNSDGSFTLSPSQAASANITITPPASYTGTMSLKLSDTDTLNHSATSTFNLVVSPAAQGASIVAPNSVNDTLNHAASIPLQVTDTHTGESVSSVTISGAPAGSTLSVGSTVLTADSHGTFTLTPAQAANASLSLTPPNNFTGLISLNVTASALNGTQTLTSSQVVSVHVANVTQGATVTVPTSAVHDTENHSASFSVNVSDTHVNETLSHITITGAPQGTTLTIDGHVLHASSHGTFTLTPAQAASGNISITPPNDYSGTMTLSLNATAQASGASAVTTSKTFTVSVDAQTQGASIELPEVAHGKEDQAARFHMEVHDNHSGEAVTAVTLTGAPSGSSLSVGGSTIHQNADGSFTLTGAQAASGEISITPPNGFVGTIDLQVNATAQNGSAAAVTTTDHISINVENVGPSGDHNQSYNINVGGTVHDNVGASAPVGDTLTYTVADHQGPQHGTVSIDQQGNFTYTAQAGYSGTDQFQIAVSDGQGGVLVQTETVRVVNPFTHNDHDDFHHDQDCHYDGSNAVYGGGGDAHIHVGDSDSVIFGNDGSETGHGHLTSQLHITAESSDEAFGASMTYALGGLNSHTNVVDSHGSVLDASHLTDSQIHDGIFLSFDDSHVSASFDLSVTANLCGTDGSVSHSFSTMHMDTSFMGGSDTISAGNGNNTIYGGAGDNLITAGDGNNTVYAYDGNNSITLGAGHNVVSVGDGNNVVNLGAGSDTITFGSGNDTVFTAGGTDTLYAGQNLTVEHLGSTLDANIMVHNTDASGGSDLMFDFGAGHNTVTGGTGANWTDTLDLTHAAAGTVITIADQSGHSWTETVGNHGTVDFTASTQNGGLNQHDVNGTVTTTDAHGAQHSIEFHNIEKISY